VNRSKVFLSLFALSLAGVSSLSAAPSALAAFDFEAGGYPAAVVGEQQGPHKFTITGGKWAIECEEAAFTGQLSEPEETPDLTPEYEGCLLGGLVSTTIANNGCAYRLHANEEVVADEFAGTVDLVCPEGQKLTMTSFTCKVQIPGQSGIGEVAFRNEVESSPTDVTLEMTLTGLEYTTQSGLFCPLPTGEAGDGTYDGAVLAEATEEAAETDFGVAIKATELCKSEEINPCKTPYAEGTVLAAQLSPSTSATFKYQFEGAQKTIACTESNLTAAIGQHVGLELSGEMNPLVFPVCEKECSGGALNAPFEIRISPDGNMGNGFLRLFKPASGPIFYAGCDGKHSCAYTSSSLSGNITGGKDATWLVADTLSTKLGISDKGCGASLTVNAKYLFYKPVVGVQPQMWVSAG
jgi:hypothetical protein